MTFRDAKKLHNGDEVVDKNTGESVKVLSAKVIPFVPGKRVVLITGIGDKQGYAEWYHGAIK